MRTELPNKWCIKSGEQLVVDYCNTHGACKPYSKSECSRNYCHFPSVGGCTTSDDIKEGYTEITYNEFYTLVINNKHNKHNKYMKTTISSLELLEIHKIACSEWKNKISLYMTRLDSAQNISFSQSEVDAMFKAATPQQKPTLERIFGKQVEIEWDKIKTGSKVMIKYNGNHCNGRENINYNKPVDVVFFKTPHFIDSKNKFYKKGAYSHYCTFHQDENYILYSADVDTEYIESVIEY